MAAHMPGIHHQHNAEEIHARLQALALFEGLTPDELTTVAQACQLVSYQSGDEIFAEGSEGTELYIMLDGKVDLIVQLSGEESPETISQLGSHDVFGELALLDGHPRSATALATEEVTALVIRRQKLFALMDTRPRLGYVIMRNLAHIMSHRLRSMDAMYSDLMAQWWSLYLYAPSPPNISPAA